MLLGFTQEQVREKEESIIEFAELGEFIDMPVKTYSSGMHSKLAFAITAILETDIMLIDEVLSVDNMKIIRPGDGASPKFWSALLGKKARHAIEFGEPVLIEDVF